MHEDTHDRGSSPRGVASPENDTQVGRLLDGRYRIGARIARGGMASVYEAHDTRLDRAVAIKIMHAGLGDATSTDEQFAARFVREARAAARLSHPNVVAVYDQGEDNGTIFLAMELVPGHTLRDTIAKEAPMSPERALAILDPVLSALASAHRSGLIHRDVKPENVLIADDGRIKVADFGLARAVNAETQHTATGGVLIGTVSYLAPELVVDGKADARADVYAAGVVLYELLTGHKPHQGESPIAVAYKHVHEDVPAPSAEVPELPAYVDALVARATTRDRSLRPADAGVLLHHVHRVTHALHHGVREDDDLVADLLPTPARVETADTMPEPIRELWDPAMAEGTTKLETALPPPPPAPTTKRTPPSPPTPATGDARPARPRRGRRGVVLLVLAALVAAAIGGGAYWFGWARYTHAPSVVGLSQASAEQKIEDAGLEVEYADAVYSTSVAAGDVVASDPAPGERILPGDAVTVMLSLGEEMHDLPKLRGLTVDEATEKLDDVKLVLGKVKEEYSEVVPKGRVISSDPPFGSKKADDMPVNAVVDLVVSRGRQPLQVGDWVGKSFEDAKAKLEARGLVVNVVGHENSDSIAEGDVISHEPTGGTLFKSDQVDFVVSDGPELIEVPAVRYSSTDDAVADLEAAGFEVDIQRAQIYISGNVAWDTNPGAGTMAEEGSKVVLYVV